MWRAKRWVAIGAVVLAVMCVAAVPSGYYTRLVTLTWATAAPSATDQTPDTDTIMDIGQATTVVGFVDTTATANTSTNVDINVHASADGTTFGTTVWDGLDNTGDAAVIAFDITVGPQSLRFRLDNDDGAQTASVTLQVFVREANY